MKSIEIKGLLREATGKTNTNSVRKDGNVPYYMVEMKSYILQHLR